MTSPDNQAPFEDAESLEELLGLFAGAASMCWENPAGAGVFDSELASFFVDAALIKIVKIVGWHESLADENKPRSGILSNVMPIDKIISVNKSVKVNPEEFPKELAHNHDPVGLYANCPACGTVILK